MRNGFRLARIAGIEVYLDWSLLIIFLLLSWSLAAGLFPAWHPDWGPTLSWVTGLAAATLFLGSVLVHELSHAVVGRAQGIEVKRITLFVFGGMAQMENEPRAWRAELLMAVVGPLTSLVLGLAFLFLGGLVAGRLELDPEHPERLLASLNPASTLLVWLGQINVILALFNLVPGFPLDGGRVLRAALWGLTRDLRKATRWASMAGQAFAWFLIFSGIAMMLGMRSPIFGGGPVAGLWLAFIGWFLNNAALVSYRQLIVREALHDVAVSRIMQTRYLSVPPAMDLATLVDEHLMGTGQRGFPVEQGERLVGLICLQDIRNVPSERRATTTIAEVMTPLASLETVSPDTDAAEALQILARRGVNQLPVVEGGRAVGLLGREDILKWLAMHGGEEILDGGPLLPPH